ncbi:arylamine N-acetyltransferase [Massilia sp. METH4]|uniref:arylamine N-acetyltransferase family protein n=1 Tax=Massilia sp. METH4 TaxID=3123041 RepID=UPI0030D30776
MLHADDAAPAALAPYFDLIGQPGTAKPSLAALARLQLGHILAIPFENLNPLAGLRVPLDTAALLDKFTHRRGGYCFEHNLLYRHALETLGYRTTPLLARVRVNVAPGTVTPRTHMLLLVDVDGERVLTDTGFGKATPTAPLRLIAGVPQQTPHGVYRLTQEGDEYQLETETGEGWAPLYAFEPRPAYQVDFEMSNWFVSTHPASHFTRDLIAVRTVANGRHVLHNGRYSFYGTDGTGTREEITTVAALVHLLENTFGLAASEVAGLEAKLGRIVGTSGNP